MFAEALRSIGEGFDASEALGLAGILVLVFLAGVALGRIQARPRCDFRRFELPPSKQGKPASWRERIP